MTRTGWLALYIACNHFIACSRGLCRDAEIERLLADYSRPLLLAAGLNPETVNIGLISAKA